MKSAGALSIGASAELETPCGNFLLARFIQHSDPLNEMGSIPSSKENFAIREPDPDWARLSFTLAEISPWVEGAVNAIPCYLTFEF